MSDRPDQCPRVLKLPSAWKFDVNHCRCALRDGHDGLHRGPVDGLLEIEVDQFDEDVGIYRGRVDAGLMWESGG